MKRTLTEHATRHSVESDELLRLLSWRGAKVWARQVAPGKFVSDLYEDEEVEKAVAAGVLASLGILG